MGSAHLPLALPVGTLPLVMDAVLSDDDDDDVVVLAASFSSAPSRPSAPSHNPGLEIRARSYLRISVEVGRPSAPSHSPKLEICAHSYRRISVDVGARLPRPKATKLGKRSRPIIVSSSDTENSPKKARRTAAEQLREDGIAIINKPPGAHPKGLHRTG